MKAICEGEYLIKVIKRLNKLFKFANNRYGMVSIITDNNCLLMNVICGEWRVWQ